MAKTESIHCEREYRYAPSTVWRCLTEPALLAMWWAAGDVKAEVGHRFELDMGPFGKQACQVLEVKPQRLLKHTFSQVLNNLITWELTPTEAGTRLTLTHEGFDLSTSIGQQAYQGMKNGWPRVLERMVGALEESTHST